MLPAHLKLNHSAEFSDTMRGAVRAGTRRVVVYVSSAVKTEELRDATEVTVTSGGPRFGFIVSKAVGNAVIRHRVSRRLRHICANVANQLSVDDRIVIRALPDSATSTSEKLEADVRHALRRIERRRAGSPAANR